MRSQRSGAKRRAVSAVKEDKGILFRSALAQRVPAEAGVPSRFCCGPELRQRRIGTRGSA